MYSFSPVLGIYVERRIIQLKVSFLILDQQEDLICAFSFVWAIYGVLKMESQTFVGLVGAFVNLTIAFLLLCASAVAFFASKFLGFFGLSLPCPCNGLFGIPRGNYCLQRLLVECPNETVSSIQLSVKSNSPFNSIWPKDHPNYRLSLRLICEGDRKPQGFVQIEDEEASSSLVSGARKSQDFVGRDSFPPKEVEFGEVSSANVMEDGRLDLKGEGIMNQKSRKRRGIVALKCGKLSSATSYSPSATEVESASQSPSSISDKSPVDSGLDTHGFHRNREAHIIRDFEDIALHSFESNKPFDEKELTEMGASSSEEMIMHVDQEAEVDCMEKDVIRILEQALEEERAASAALYIELEKERNAAATAADEAMAMILRLQEEKASMEMETRQYQRMIEEKSTYDDEEMSILKEIIVRREREKHSLEKEVEAYREAICPTNQL